MKIKNLCEKSKHEKVNMKINFKIVLFRNVDLVKKSDNNCR